MIASFADEGTEDIFRGLATSASRRALPAELHRIARHKLAIIEYADELDMLRIPPGNRLEKLRGNRVGQYSIRINDQYRICFRWDKGQASDVEVADYH